MQFQFLQLRMMSRSLFLLLGLIHFVFVQNVVSAENTNNNSSIIVKAGSGFAVNKNGYILTASHVIPEGSNIKVYSSAYPNGINANVVKVDRSLDLALLKIDQQTKPISIAKWSTVPNGLLIFSLGYPSPDILGRELKITSGLINALEGIDKRPGLFQFSAPIQMGNSGGPIISSDLNVVGLTQGKFDSASGNRNNLQNVNLAIQSKVIEEFLLAEKIEFNLKAFNPNLVKPSQVVYSESEASLFMVVASVKGASKTDKKINIDDNIRVLLGTLSKDDKPKLFGAFKVGFDRLLDIGREQIMIKSSSIQKLEGNSQIVKFDSILSLNKPRLYEDQQSYLSLIMTSQYDCVNQAIMITRKEFKEDLFGTGKTIAALSKKEGSPNDFKPFKSENINTFILRTACENLPVVANEKTNLATNDSASTEARSQSGNDSVNQENQARMQSAKAQLNNVAKLEQPNNINFSVTENQSESIKTMDETNNMVKEALVIKPETLVKTDTEQELIRNSLNHWKMAWAEKNIDKYLQSYSITYAPEGKTHQEWLDQRIQRIKKAGRIEITIEEIKIQKQDQRYSSVFVQHYSSDLLKEKVIKTLEWEKVTDTQQTKNVSDKWVIVRETSQPIR